MKEKIYPYITLFLIWIGHFMVDMMIGIWPIYKTMAGLDLALAGLIAGICPFFGEGLQIVFGNLGDKGYRKVLTFIGIMATSAAVLFPYSQSYLILFFLYLLVCIGSGAFHPSAVAIVSSLTTRRKGFFVAIFATGGYVGMALSQISFSTLYIHFKENIIYEAIPLILLSLIALSINIPSLHGLPSQQGRKYGFSAMKKLFKNRNLVILYLSQVCNQTLFWGMIFLLPDVLISKGYGSWISLGGGHLLFVLGGALMIIPGGYLSDRYSARSVLFVAFFTGLLLFYAFVLSYNLSNSMVLLLLFGLGSTMGLINPVAVALGHRMMPSRPGLVSAFLMGLVWCISETIGPGGGGLLTKLFSENAPEKALLFFGVFFVGGLICVYFLPKVAQKEEELECELA